MAICKIISVPDKRLREISKPVARVDDALRKLMDDMAETMYAANGIGLAAIQTGVALCVIVMDLDRRQGEEAADFPAADTRNEEGGGDGEGIRFFVNPEIVWASDETANYQEGCLSVPGFYDDVVRPARCRVAFLDYDGKEQELNCDGLLATCIQHEMDHLNGIVFIDHLSRLKRERILAKIKKANKEVQRQTSAYTENRPAAG